MKNIVRKRILTLPNFDTELDLRRIPELDKADYINRIDSLQSKMGTYSHLIIYGDREHFSNIEFFTGFDPRFEEALLIIPQEGTPTIIVGNEGESYSNIIKYDIRKLVYPPFSLPGQPRKNVIQIEDLFRMVGLNASSNVGLVGWKVFSREDLLDPSKTFDIPFFIVASLLNIVPLKNMCNAIHLMVGLDSGMRITLEIKELILSEIAGTLASRNTYRVLQNLQIGMSEIEASEYLKINGMPLSVHPNINFGKNLSYALASPMARTTLKYGDVIGVGMAFRRTLCHKVGYYIKDDFEEPAVRKEFYDKYFRTMAAWYESLRIGVAGEQVYEAAREKAGDFAEFGIELNPGHLIHTDEWTNTLFKPGCSTPLRSGMMIQCDFTAAKPEDDLIAHAEDGLLLADAETRNRIEKASPSAWHRIQERRKFMINELGIMISEEVLPTSDLSGIIFPFMCDLKTVIAFE